MTKKLKFGPNVPAPPPLPSAQLVTSPNKKTHQRSQSDATGLFQSLRRNHSGIFSIFNTNKLLHKYF